VQQGDASKSPALLLPACNATPASEFRCNDAQTAFIGFFLLLFLVFWDRREVRGATVFLIQADFFPLPITYFIFI